MNIFNSVNACLSIIAMIAIAILCITRRHHMSEIKRAVLEQFDRSFDEVSRRIRSGG